MGDSTTVDGQFTKGHLELEHEAFALCQTSQELRRDAEELRRTSQEIRHHSRQIVERSHLQRAQVILDGDPHWRLSVSVVDPSVNAG